MQDTRLHSACDLMATGKIEMTSAGMATVWRCRPQPSALGILRADKRREREVRRRMAGHELYRDVGAGLEALEEERVRGKELTHDFNVTRPRETAKREELLKRLFGAAGEHVWIEPPVYVAYGRHTYIGRSVYANVGLTLVDDSEIVIGDRVMFEPHVTISTAGHPVHPDLRSDGAQFSAAVQIEDDVWIGSNVTILPGVTVRRGSIVAAGALVTAERAVDDRRWRRARTRPAIDYRHGPAMELSGSGAGAEGGLAREAAGAADRVCVHPMRTASLP
jgi:galactoside O-acetyltransferase